MSEWKECKLGDAPIEIIDGDRGKNYPKKDEFYENGYCLFLNTKNVTTSGFSFTELNFITKQKDGLLRKGKLKRYDLVLTTRGTVGNVGFYNDNVIYDKLRINSGMVIIRPNGIDKEFNYQLFKYLKKDFETFTTGSAQPQLPIRDLKEMSFLLPPLSEQKAITSVLSSLDDKIDLLHRQNKTLEAMAETLFRQWFVPARAGEPHAGGEEAQEDLEEKRLGDILTSIESGSRPKGGIDPDLKHGIPSIGAENINGIGNYNHGSTKYITSEYFKRMKRGIVQDYDVLIYKDGAYIGKKSMFAKGFPFKKCAINEHVFILRTESIFLQLFLYFALEQEELALLNANSAQPGLNQTSMKSFELLLPKSELVEMFGQTIMPLIDKIFFNGNQIRTLEKLRDTLLPKLMSGEVTVWTFLKIVDTPNSQPV